MPWNELAEERCPIARTVSVLGDRWTLLVVRQAVRGATRFEEFRKALDISPTLLDQRLKTLCEHGILERVADEARPRRPEYRLTAKGLELAPVLLAIVQWGEKHYPDELGSEYVLQHARCAQEFTPVVHVTCSACDEPVPVDEIRLFPREESA